ncbi:hypothetical protein [Pseudoduganella sp. R-43]|uniref:hypothetical protein n=1 Tax=Pseudoduganella sp. R-43 TaxID=3404063 RepID=UPI003CEF5967
MGEHFTTTSNVVLAQRNEQIVVLTEFTAAFQVLGPATARKPRARMPTGKKQGRKEDCACRG